LRDNLGQWYWAEGNGIYLSRPMVTMYLRGDRLLLAPSLEKERIREHYSKVRTNIKVECGILGHREAVFETLSEEDLLALEGGHLRPPP
jgi:hypothetical protein